MRTAAAVFGVVVSTVLAGMAGRASAGEDGTVYLWVDKDGTPHYQDRPPDDSSSKELSMRYKLTDGTAVAAATRHKAELADAAQIRQKQQAEDKANDDEDKSKVLSEREQGCKQAQERLQKYSTAHRLYKPGPDGQRTYLTDEETDAARAEAAKSVDEWCGK